MSVKKALVQTGIISSLLLGFFHSIDLQAQQVKCDEIADKLTQSTPAVVNPAGSGNYLVFARGIDNR
jgi:hypothetical protein